MTRQGTPPSPRCADSAQIETKSASTPALPSERIRAAVAGDRVAAGDWYEPVTRLQRTNLEVRRVVTGARQKDEHFIAARCPATSPGSYVCTLCRVYLANVTQLNFHTEQGEHVIARVCSLHGAEEI